MPDPYKKPLANHDKSAGPPRGRATQQWVETRREGRRPEGNACDSQLSIPLLFLLSSQYVGYGARDGPILTARFEREKPNLLSVVAVKHTPEFFKEDRKINFRVRLKHRLCPHQGTVLEQLENIRDFRPISRKHLRLLSKLKEALSEKSSTFTSFTSKGSGSGKESVKMNRCGCGGRRTYRRS